MIERILLPLALALITLTPAAAASPQEQRGKTFAMNNCAKCHSIDKVSAEPAQDRAAVPDAAQALPRRNTGRSAG